MNEQVRLDIMNKVREHREMLLNQVGIKPRQLLCVAAYGSMNYGTYIHGISDVDTKAIYLPDFDEMAFEKPKSVEYHWYDDSHCELKDIREMMKMWKKQNINFIEILFTDFIMVNPRYADLWEQLIAIREKIAHYNEQYAFKSASCQALNTLQRMRKKGYDGKTYANVVRIALFLDRYYGGKDYKTCMYAEDRSKTLYKIRTNGEEVGTQLVDPTSVEQILTMYKYNKNFKGENLITKTEMRDIERNFLLTCTELKWQVEGLRRHRLENK